MTARGLSGGVWTFVLGAFVLVGGCAEGLPGAPIQPDPMSPPDASPSPVPDAAPSDGSPGNPPQDAGPLDAGNEGGITPPMDAGVDAAPAPSCTDQMRNGNETDVDCGGSCPKCANGAMCSVANDCSSGICEGDRCVAPVACTSATECSGGVCRNGACAPCPNEGNCTCAARDGVPYWFCRSGRSFTAATSDCESVGMRLVRIDSAAENQWVRDRYRDSAINLSDPWIGARDATTPGEWQWADGTLFWTGGRMGSVVSGFYANWNSGHPDNSRCGSFSGWDSNRLWEGRSCGDSRHFICKAY